MLNPYSKRETVNDGLKWHKDTFSPLCRGILVSQKKKKSLHSKKHSKFFLSKSFFKTPHLLQLLTDLTIGEPSPTTTDVASNGCFLWFKFILTTIIPKKFNAILKLFQIFPHFKILDQKTTIYIYIMLIWYKIQYSEFIQLRESYK